MKPNIWLHIFTSLWLCSTVKKLIRLTSQYATLLSLQHSPEFLLVPEDPKNNKCELNKRQRHYDSEN